MPHYNYVAEVRKLRAQERYGEAMTVGNAGRSVLHGRELADLDVAVAEVEADENSWLRRGKDVLLGAITGDGKSLEAMAGTITADMFVVGDVRDILIQGAHQVIDGDSDVFTLTIT